MDSGNTKTKYEELGLSQKIIISNEIYTFKKLYINDFVSYRYIHRNCKASIKISLEVAKKINNKVENNRIILKAEKDTGLDTVDGKWEMKILNKNEMKIVKAFLVDGDYYHKILTKVTDEKVLEENKDKTYDNHMKSQEN